MSNHRLSDFSILPAVVKNLLIINGLCFLAYVVLADRGIINLNETLGLYYPESKFFKPYQLISHVFMHGSFMHLFFNMFSLWMFGNVLENYWGPKRFFIYYFVTAFGSAALHIGVNAFEVMQIKQAIAGYISSPGYDSFLALQEKIDPTLIDNDYFQSFMREWQTQKQNPQLIQGSIELTDAMVQRKINVPTVGASGAVFGLLLAFGMLFPNTQLMMLFFPFPIKAKYFVMIYGALELYQGVANNPTDHVAHFAHLGGMLFGFILIKIWNKTNRHTFY
ncbi:MAG: rhomboid family intramembrane serine protease [Bacteroidota bacterium]|jgi:membrane associated rhomboid family serine protease|nr:rhomboid family intramembrane serine protease [Sphingobacteriales bacterium]